MTKAKNVAVKQPRGRPSLCTPAIMDEICERITEGESLRAICQAAHMPHRSNVLRWLHDHADFAAKYARAREAQGDLMDERILAVADACQPETAAADRIKIDAYKWRASKLAPKRYGDKLTVGGDPDSPIAMTVQAIERHVIDAAE